jgi:hypothetical protein
MDDYKSDALLRHVVLTFAAAGRSCSSSLLVAGFGNSLADSQAYEMAGISRSDIYIIDKRSRISCLNAHDGSVSLIVDNVKASSEGSLIVDQQGSQASLPTEASSISVVSESQTNFFTGRFSLMVRNTIFDFFHDVPSAHSHTFLFETQRTWKRAPALGTAISKFSRRYFISTAVVAMAVVCSYNWSGFAFDNLCSKFVLCASLLDLLGSLTNNFPVGKHKDVRLEYSVHCDCRRGKDKLSILSTRLAPDSWSLVSRPFTDGRPSP